MAIGKDLVRKVYELNEKVHEDTREYYHTRPLAISRSSIVLADRSKQSFEIYYDIRDLFTIGALTHSSILMTGGTDSGKTTLAKLVMNSLFGGEEEGWHRIDVDTDFGKDAYADVNFEVMKDGKKLSEGFYSAMPFLRLPGLILDEINRAHAAIINKLLHVFDKDISLPDGSRAKIGYAIKNSQTYQLQIAAINEGKDYSGTFDIDKALRRRTIIEIPMDIFPPTPYDRLCIQKKGKKEIELKNTENRLENILEIYEKVDGLTLHPTAELFVAYLEAFDYCKHSLTGEKGGVASLQGSIHKVCTQPIKIDGRKIGEDGMGCRFFKEFENELCPFVRGLSPGISKNLINVAKGFALLRASKFVELVYGTMKGENEKSLSYYVDSPEDFKTSLMRYIGEPLQKEELAKKVIGKYFENLEVQIEDIESALGFVGYSKIGISNLWIEKYYQGNRYEAVKNFCREARSKLEKGLSREILVELPEILNGEASGQQIQDIKRYCEEENPWLWRVLSPYMVKENGEKKAEIEELYS